MKLHFDYATAAHGTQAWVWWLLTAASLATVLAGWQYSQLQAARAGLALQLEEASAVKKAPAVAPLSLDAQAALKEQVKQANAVLAELGHPWPAMFSHLEHATGKDIALLAIRPDAGKGRIRLVGEARHLADVLEYVRRLATVSSMTDVVLEGHEVVESDPQKPVRFELSARWGEAG